MGLIDTHPKLRFNNNSAYPIATMKRDKVPIIYLPFELREKVSDYDTDYNNYLERKNSNGENEFKQIMGLNFSKYKITETVQIYNDNTIEVSKKLPSGMKITEVHKENCSFERLENQKGEILVEKLYSDNDNTARKTLYKRLGSENHKFNVVKNYTYNPEKNSANDLLDYAYYKDEKDLLKNCKFLNEYFEYNGKAVDSKFVKYDEENKRYVYENPDNGTKLYFSDKK